MSLEKLKAKMLAWPKTTCFLGGGIGALAMAPTYIWPALMVSLCTMLFIISRTQNPRQGGWYAFLYGMGYFTFGLFWVANALFIEIETYWWAVTFAIFGLPLLLSLLWFVAGYLTVRFSRPQTLARSVLFLSLLAAAEYGRAFNLSGFPWNLMGYTWISLLPVAQLAAIGGAYFVTALTLFWMATPMLAVQSDTRKTRVLIMALSCASFVGAFTFGAQRLATHEPDMRDDVGVIIVQPNIPQEEKWSAAGAVKHFMRHVDITRAGLKSIKDKGVPYKNIAVVWPETSLDEGLSTEVPEVGRALLDMLADQDGAKVSLATGFWREGAMDTRVNMNTNYNSVAVVSRQGDQLNLDAVYDKHHLVPFGEYVPLQETLNLKPLVGFAGFGVGPGPKVLSPLHLPPLSAMICFEAIFPWYATGAGAQWLVNPSNDGWYGNAPGPYQHLGMSRFRAIEQGKPIARAASTGISSIIDPYGRALQTLGYNVTGYIISPLPRYISGGTVYTKIGEWPFFGLVALGFVFFLALHKRKI